MPRRSSRQFSLLAVVVLDLGQPEVLSASAVPAAQPHIPAALASHQLMTPSRARCAPAPCCDPTSLRTQPHPDVAGIRWWGEKLERERGRGRPSRGRKHDWRRRWESKRPATDEGRMNDTPPTLKWPNAGIRAVHTDDAYAFGSNATGRKWKHADVLTRNVWPADRNEAGRN